MHGQQCKLGFQSNSKSFCLPCRRLDGDNYVAQRFSFRTRGPGSVILGRGHAGKLISLREGKDVRGFVETAIVPIESVDRRVIGQEEADLGITGSFTPQDRSCGPTQQARPDRAGLGVQQGDRHS